MNCPYCGAALHGEFCSRCGRRGSDGMDAPPFFSGLDRRQIVRATLVVGVAAVLYLVPALGAAAAVIFLLRKLRDLNARV